MPLFKLLLENFLGHTTVTLTICPRPVLVVYAFIAVGSRSAEHPHRKIWLPPSRLSLSLTKARIVGIVDGQARAWQ